MNPKKDKTNFSVSEIEKIRGLNSKLKIQEERIKAFSIQLFSNNKKLFGEHQVDAFHFNCILLVFSNSSYCNKRNSVEFGNPIYLDESWMVENFLDELNEANESNNWNELREITDHPLSHEHFCYTMHRLCFDSTMTWNDIIDISDVWLELKLSYQFIAE